MSAAIHITDASFEAEVIQSSMLTVTDFWAEWCMPCKRLAPILDEIANQYADQIKIAKVDVDDYPGIAERYGITGIPALLVFKGGELVETLVGFLPKDKILAKLTPHLN